MKEKTCVLIGCLLVCSLYLNVSSYAVEKDKVESSQVNLLYNGTFEEEGKIGTQPKGWRFYRTIDKGPYRANQGGSSFTKEEDGYSENYRGVITKGADIEWVLINQKIQRELQIGEEYILSAWLKADKPAVVDLYLAAREGEAGKQSRNRKRLTVKSYWKHCSVTVKIQHSGQTNSLRSVIQLYTSGVKLDIDDVELKVISKKSLDYYL